MAHNLLGLHSKTPTTQTLQRQQHEEQGQLGVRVLHTELLLLLLQPTLQRRRPTTSSINSSISSTISSNMHRPWQQALLGLHRQHHSRHSRHRSKQQQQQEAALLPLGLRLLLEWASSSRRSSTSRMRLRISSTSSS